MRGACSCMLRATDCVRPRRASAAREGRGRACAAARAPHDLMQPVSSHSKMHWETRCIDGNHTWMTKLWSAILPACVALSSSRMANTVPRPVAASRPRLPCRCTGWRADGGSGGGGGAGSSRGSVGVLVARAGCCAAPQRAHARALAGRARSSARRWRPACLCARAAPPWRLFVQRSAFWPGARASRAAVRQNRPGMQPSAPAPCP